MLRCLTEAIGETHVACAEETVRAVHSALQFYQPVRSQVCRPRTLHGLSPCATFSKSLWHHTCHAVACDRSCA